MIHHKPFTYYDYATRGRDLALVEDHLRGFIPYFAKCRHVVDIGSGTGIFLRLLRDAGIRATGIENDPALVEQIQLKGCEVMQGDATSIWAGLDFAFDGIFCSHLVEHLPFEQVVGMVEGCTDRIDPGGIVVFAFPNPESLEMQLFHFWRDPQHVRFYHPDIIAGLLRHYGIEIDNVFAQGSWGGETAPHAGGQRTSTLTAIKRFGLLRRSGRAIKQILGITALEVEADYMRQLRAIGREAVVVGRKARAI